MTSHEAASTPLFPSTVGELDTWLNNVRGETPIAQAFLDVAKESKDMIVANSGIPVAGNPKKALETVLGMVGRNTGHRLVQEYGTSAPSVKPSLAEADVNKAIAELDPHSPTFKGYEGSEELLVTGAMLRAIAGNKVAGAETQHV